VSIFISIDYYPDHYPARYIFFFYPKYSFLLRFVNKRSKKW